jgi:aryl carrier protein AsbD
MKREEIVEKVAKIFKQNLELTIKGDIKESDRTWEDLGLDSIMAMQLVVYLEEEFDIEVSEDVITEDIFNTVGSVVDFVINLQESKVKMQ